MSEREALSARWWCVLGGAALIGCAIASSELANRSADASHTCEVADCVPIDASTAEPHAPGQAVYK